MNPFRKAFLAFVLVVASSFDKTCLGFCSRPQIGLHYARPATRLSSSLSKREQNDARHKPMRGERYYADGSTLPSPKVIARQLGVKPTKEASNKTWKRAFSWHKKSIPILHSTDGCKPPDSSLNLMCMWWKGLAGNDKSSPVYDRGLAYDLLPSGWRKLIKPARLYPRLHHGNVELRTAYLDQQVTTIAADTVHDNQKIRLVCMGAGYDTRGIKMIERGTVDQVYELDLPNVVEAKERLFGRLKRRRPWLQDLDMPTLIPSDFNDLPDLETKLRNILATTDDSWYTIFVFEGVMIYLNDGVPSGLLNVTSTLLKESNLEGSLCFADLLENVPGGNYDYGVKEMESNGWKLEDWSPKPGLARHMGSASLMAKKS